MQYRSLPDKKANRQRMYPSPFPRLKYPAYVNEIEDYHERKAEKQKHFRVYLKTIENVRRELRAVDIEL